MVWFVAVIRVHLWRVLIVQSLCYCRVFPVEGKKLENREGEGMRLSGQNIEYVVRLNSCLPS